MDLGQVLEEFVFPCEGALGAGDWKAARTVVRVEVGWGWIWEATEGAVGCASVGLDGGPVWHTDPFLLWEMDRLFVAAPVVFLSKIRRAESTLEDFIGMGGLPDKGFRFLQC